MGDLEHEGYWVADTGLSELDRVVIAKAASMIRPCVAAFAEKMEIELRENDHKGGWEDSFEKLGNLRYLLRRLKQEVGELERSIEVHLGDPLLHDDRNHLASVAKIVSESADCGNFAMMIADVVGGLRSDGGAYGR